MNGVKITALIIASVNAALSMVACAVIGTYLIFWLHQPLWGGLVLFFGTPTAYAQFVVFGHVLERISTGSRRRLGPTWPEGEPLRIVVCPQCGQPHKFSALKIASVLRCVACNIEFAPGDVPPGGTDIIDKNKGH